MRRLIYRYLMTMAVGTAVSALAKLLFIALNAGLYAGIGLRDIAAVIFHGLPMDMAVAAYVAVIPSLAWGVSLWTGSAGVVDRVMRCYFALIAAVMSLALLTDAVLYGYWRFKLDVTPFSYFASSPAAAMASAPWWQILLGITGWTALGAGIWYLYDRCVLRLCGDVKRVAGLRCRLSYTLASLLLTAMLILPVRGGVTVSTMNLSRAYFCDDTLLNHAAVNPVFSLLYSATHQSDFGSQYRFYDDAEAARIFAGLRPKAPAQPQTSPLLRVSHPDIHIIILESFSSHLMPSLGGEPVAKGLDSIASAGLVWDNFYASSFRTDRGIPAILSGYPGQPGTSIMKYVSKTDNLPSLSRSLVERLGYRAEYFYGGDINFCNQLAYLRSARFGTIVSDKDFDISERMSKWGVHDDVLFSRVLAGKRHYDPSAPLLRVIQTSSSHEPFDVPYGAHGFDDKRAVAFAYADSCVTAYVNRLRRSPAWENTLVVLVPDHYGAWPELANPTSRHAIPLVMTGGALARRGREHTTGSQVDIAPTLLAALGLPHDEFIFGNDLLDDGAPHFAYFADPSYIGFITDGNTLIYNLDTNRTTVDSGREAGSNLPRAKAYLQTLYDDLDRR